MGENRWPIAKEALPFLIPAALLAILLGALGWEAFSVLAGLLTLFIAYFFRNPRREIPDLKNVILAPADGRIIQVDEVEEGRFLKEKALKVSIFMSIFNVHINRSPTGGKVIDLSYQPGQFLVASVEKASVLNEQNALLIEAEGRFRFVLVQIAGFIARRIVCYAKTGDALKRGEPFGLIRFGSRVDLYLPADVKPTVRVGQQVKGGESIIGYHL